MWRVIFLLCCSFFAQGQPEVLFAEIMENKTFLAQVDYADSIGYALLAQRYPNAPEGKFAVAMLKFKDEDLAACKATLDSIKGASPNFKPYVLVMQGALFELMGQLLAALDRFNAALKRTPGFILALCHRGMVYYHTDNLFAAENDFLAILKIKGENPDFLMNLAAVKTAQTDYNAAFEYYQRSLQVAGNDATLLAESYAGMGHSKLLTFAYDDALQYYQSAIKYNPQHGESYYEMGLIKRYKGDKNGGCQDLILAKSLGINIDKKDMKGCPKK